MIRTWFDIETVQCGTISALDFNDDFYEKASSRLRKFIDQWIIRGWNIASLTKLVVSKYFEYFCCLIFVAFLFTRSILKMSLGWNSVIRVNSGKFDTVLLQRIIIKLVRNSIYLEYNIIKQNNLKEIRLFESYFSRLNRKSNFRTYIKIWK